MKSVYILRKDQPFSLDATLSCGQVFRWNRTGDWWAGVSGRNLIQIRQTGRELEYTGCDEVYLEHYFNLDFDLEAAADSFCVDDHIRKAVEKSRGLRIIRQEPWECLLSYLCAQNTGIPNIRNMLERMAAMYGERIESEGMDCYAFPFSEKLARCCDSDIKRCSTGYRSKYICETSRLAAENELWADHIRSLDYKDARRAVMGFPGVGPKVADCVLLFGFQFYESFPVDVWIRRIMNELYGAGRPEVPMSAREYGEIANFGRSYFGKYAGYAQEYLFAGRQ